MDSNLKPTCSVCIANYNGMEVIEACIRSVQLQDINAQIEIIVHDDASTDNSAIFIQNKFPDVKLIHSKENVGFCISNNRMAEVAKGEYLLFLNNDAELYSDALRTLYNSARKEPSAILGLPQYNAETGKLIDRGQFFDLFLNPIPNLDPEIENVGMISGSCIWVSKSVWNELGGFPDFFSSLAEDLYLCCVARLWGYTVRVINGSGYRHWVGSSFGGGKVQEKRLSTSIRRRALSERNKTFVMAICYPSPFFQLVFPVHFCLLLLEGMALSAIKRDGQLLKKIYLSAYLDLLKNIKKLFIYRRFHMRKRQISITLFLVSFQFVVQKLRMFLVYGIPKVA